MLFLCNTYLIGFLRILSCISTYKYFYPMVKFILVPSSCVIVTATTLLIAVKCQYPEDL